MSVSWRVAKYLSPYFDDILHVDNAGLGTPLRDSFIFSFAVENAYNIITKDDDFLALALLSNTPTKVIRLLNAQLPVKTMAQRILHQLVAIQSFLNSDEKVLLLDLKP